MRLNSLIDFADAATNEIAKFTFPVTISPEKMLVEQNLISSLVWSSISYGESEIEKVPDDQRGIYAFVICHNDSVLTPHGYILYIGIAGRNSNRSLRTRYRDYLNVKKVLKRARIARMVGTWHKILRFFFAPIENDVSGKVLEALERQLNTAFMPPFSEGDLDAETKNKRRAFK